MKQKPLIAIVCHQSLKNGSFENVPNELGQTYSSAITKAGGLPILIPIDFPLDDLKRLRSTFDGLLLAGGGDVETALYGGKAHPSVSPPLPMRDVIEIQLAKMAATTDWPMLGICRGVQVINVAFGKKLYSDIADQFPTDIRHNSPSDTPRDAIIHQVSVQPDSRLYKWIGTDHVPVNSFHHQALSSVGGGWNICAYAEDGLIEAIESPDMTFGLGVQWHPECMQAFPEQMRIFEAFVQAAQKA